MLFLKLCLLWVKSLITLLCERGFSSSFGVFKLPDELWSILELDLLGFNKLLGVCDLLENSLNLDCGEFETFFSIDLLLWNPMLGFLSFCIDKGLEKLGFDFIWIFKTLEVLILRGKI
ncbi:unnamed protein product [Blepharisma stoltei]|uniref:Uncharacterized protein n=1 Tax=Blepharisma stoltei TaxID=1481888 RepID=A0AAU9KAI1_9CILI|nr:unnamed protein product [Blepharisma stoltei]